VIVHGRASLYDILEDFVAYRSLRPFDARLRSAAKTDSNVGEIPPFAPRKCDPGYGEAVVALLTRARALERPLASPRHLVYVGDSYVTDVAAFRSIATAGSWAGVAFIGHETALPESMALDERDGLTVVSSNRWSGIGSLEAIAASRGVPIDPSTTVIIDIDKTALGARGRNDALLDDARRQALRHTLGALLEAQDDGRIDALYDQINGTAMHPLTGDNQDLIAYLTLIAASGVLTIEALHSGLANGSIAGFDDVLDHVTRCAVRLPPPLRSVHDHVVACRAAGDPTPFKAFRRREYVETIHRMGVLESTFADELLLQEIVLTHEVLQAALRWKQRGALLFGLSDKPDEACNPTEVPDAVSSRPVHRTPTHSVGA
jgi:hypothetical protein